MSDPHPNLPVSIPAETTNQTLAHMKAAHRWLLCKSVPRPGKKPAKVPYYVNGGERGKGLTLDSPGDLKQLVTYDEAVAAYQNAPPGEYAGLGFALGNGWQGVDLDDIVANGLGSIANEWSVGSYAEWCYAELSPSEKGMHVIGYGQPFPTLGANGTGIEAYSGGRYFTFTGREVLPQGGVKHGRPGDLHDYVVDVLRPIHSASKSANLSYAGRAVTEVSPTTIAALRSAIHFWDPNVYDDWYRAGLALKDLGLPGFEIWNTWSQLSLKQYNAKEAKRKWDDDLTPNGITNYRSIFTVARDRFWVNPDGKESLSVRFCKCGATVVLPPLRLNLATGELNVGKLGGYGKLPDNLWPESSTLTGRGSVMPLKNNGGV